MHMMVQAPILWDLLKEEEQTGGPIGVRTFAHASKLHSIIINVVQKASYTDERMTKTMPIPSSGVARN